MKGNQYIDWRNSMAFRQIKTPALADQAVINTKLDVTSVSGQTELAALGAVSADMFLIYDSSADALKKISATNILGSMDTDALAEGTTNLYYTDARVEAKIDAYVTGGTGVTVTSGEVAIGQDVATTADVTFNSVSTGDITATGDVTAATVETSGNIIVGGDLTVRGTTTTVDSTTVQIGDNIIELNKDATAGTVDAGISVVRGADGDKSFIWNETDDRWSTEGEALAVSTLVGDVLGDVTGTVSDISNHDTDALAEGTTNLYYTTARQDAQADIWLATKTADDVAEGSVNFYYTEAKFDSSLATKTTDDLTEGTANLYFTDGRADARIAAASIGDLVDVDISAIGDGTTIVWDAAGGTFTVADHFDTADFAANVALLTTDDIAEGTSKYFTDARARAAISAAGDLSYDAATGVMSFTERTDAEVRGLISGADDVNYDAATGVISVVTYKSTDFDTDFGNKTTDDLGEGTTNLFYTEARFDTSFGNKTTDDLAEGTTNLFYTDARVANYLTTNSYATETYVDTAVANLIDGAPAVLDTLNELAAALGDDPNFVTTITTSIATKLDLAGGTMTGDIAMGGNAITGLVDPSAAQDAATKAYVDTAIQNQDISLYTTDDLVEGTTNLYYTEARWDAKMAAASTDDLAEGTNLYYTQARFDAAFALKSIDDLVDVDTTTVAPLNGQGLKWDGTNWVPANMAATVLELTDVTDSTYTGKDNYVLVVNDTEDGMELIDPASIVFAQNNRIILNGDGAQATFSLGFTASQANALVFVGGVIQDPTTHYTITGSSITFASAIPTGTQAVVINPSVGSMPTIQDGQVTPQKFASNVKAYVQKLAVTTGTGGNTVDTFDGTAYRSAKYIIQVSNSAGTEFETREALVVHDGGNAYITEYALVYTGAGLLGDASVAMNGTDINLVYTANAADTEVKVIATYIDA